MEVIPLANGHALEILSSLATIGSVLFAAIEIRQVVKTQRVSNLLTLTKHHREIWSGLHNHPELQRVLDPNPNLEREPITKQESLFVTFLILHLNSSFRAAEARMFRTGEALGEDVRWLFSLPIPRAVWQQSRKFQDRNFVRFVDSHLS